MSKKDFYEVLGAAKGDDDAALKKAYRKKAMKYHPDRNPGDTEAEKHFKEVNEAYDVLKDPQKRAAYDRMGHAAFEGGMGGGAGGFGAGFGGGAGGFEDIFGDAFGDMFGDMFGGGRRSSARRGPTRGSDLRYDLTVNLDEAYEGKEVELTIPTSDACSTCDGSGAKPGSKPTTCSTCQGSGQVHVAMGPMRMAQACPSCGGEGQMVSDPCTSCHGSGVERKKKTINVTVPKGVDDGTRIRVSGEGEAGQKGGPKGDLYIYIGVREHEFFQREGEHIVVDMPLDFTDAALGGYLEVPTPDGSRAKLTIPEGTQTGQRFRLRGKGMPILNRSSYGDMYVIVHVEVPTSLSKKQKELLRQFKNDSKDKNNPQQESFAKKVKDFWKNCA